MSEVPRPASIEFFRKSLRFRFLIGSEFSIG